jgi:hypothetical protein
MAASSYGYGRWSAPCWFVGPEQGLPKAGVELDEARLGCLTYRTVSTVYVSELGIALYRACS